MTGNLKPYDPRTRQIFNSTVRPDSWRTLTCEEAECEAYEQGFAVVTEPDGPVADHIRRNRVGWVEAKRPDGQVGFLFEPGVECFAQHRVAALPPRLVHLPGRGGAQQPSRREVAEAKPWRPPDWLENWQEHTSRVSEIRKREGLTND